MFVGQTLEVMSFCLFCKVKPATLYIITVLSACYSSHFLTTVNVVNQNLFRAYSGFVILPSFCIFSGLAVLS